MNLLKLNHQKIQKNYVASVLKVWTFLETNAARVKISKFITSCNSCWVEKFRFIFEKISWYPECESFGLARLDSAQLGSTLWWHHSKLSRKAHFSFIIDFFRSFWRLRTFSNNFLAFILYNFRWTLSIDQPCSIFGIFGLEYHRTSSLFLRISPFFNIKLTQFIFFVDLSGKQMVQVLSVLP